MPAWNSVKKRATSKKYYLNKFTEHIATLRGGQNHHVLTFQAYVHSGFRSMRPALLFTKSLYLAFLNFENLIYDNNSQRFTPTFYDLRLS